MPSTELRPMQSIRGVTLELVWKLLAGLLVLKVTSAVVLNYVKYIPPDFESEFLQGRELYFASSYQWAFYTHLVAGPLSLVWGLILLSDRFRLRSPRWHRYLGRMQVICVLFLLLPSGLWMSCFAATGAIAGAGFGTLAIVTGVCLVLGWQAAVRRRFVEHRRWMWRSFLCLCSAVVVRMIGGLATVADIEAEWVYPLAAWASWLVPLLAYEVLDRANLQLNASATVFHAHQPPHGNGDDYRGDWI